MNQRVHQVGQLFGGVLRARTHKGTCRAKKSKMSNKAQNQDLLTLIDR